MRADLRVVTAMPQLVKARHPMLVAAHRLTINQAAAHLQLVHSPDNQSFIRGCPWKSKYSSIDGSRLTPSWRRFSRPQWSQWRLLAGRTRDPPMQARPVSGQLQKANFLRVTERIGERHTAEFMKHGSVPRQTISETSIKSMPSCSHIRTSKFTLKFASRQECPNR